VDALHATSTPAESRRRVPQTEKQENDERWCAKIKEATLEAKMKAEVTEAP
jgi:hypothetical protein